ncbi:hypothetical protein C1I60_18710 [Paenibacillus terrae]|uniref:Uncharacterized protein n=1 Tax=Paenibacillus terrae TaxID=159743 RepID=A0A4U2PSJ1_9BACL|nr:hypothetical protein C1I60_18710 [Paenibacillus terrae]
MRALLQDDLKELIPYSYMIENELAYKTRTSWSNTISEKNRLKIRQQMNKMKVRLNLRNEKVRPEGMTSKGTPRCSMGFAMTYWVWRTDI